MLDTEIPVEALLPPTMQRMDLHGKNVVVTGAGRGIGEALAREFHARGARVLVADLHGANDVANSYVRNHQDVVDASLSSRLHVR